MSDIVRVLRENKIHNPGPLAVMLRALLERAACEIESLRAEVILLLQHRAPPEKT